MRDYLDIGPTPCDESCQQVGTDSYDPVKARKECLTFLKQLRRILGPEPTGTRLAIKSFPHDFGSYEDVVCHYDSGIPESREYAYRAESESPANWDDEARKELGL